jgi:hypothetical protein
MVLWYLQSVSHLVGMYTRSQSRGCGAFSGRWKPQLSLFQCQDIEYNIFTHWIQYIWITISTNANWLGVAQAHVLWWVVLIVYQREEQHCTKAGSVVRNRLYKRFLKYQTPLSVVDSLNPTNKSKPLSVGLMWRPTKKSFQFLISTSINPWHCTSKRSSRKMRSLQHQ